MLNPNIEEIDGIKIPIFKYFQASFILEGPKDVITIGWIKKIIFINSMRNFLRNGWMNGGDSLQDGCSYFFGGACYALAGFGEHGCNMDPESIEKAFN